MLGVDSVANGGVGMLGEVVFGGGILGAPYGIGDTPGRVSGRGLARGGGTLGFVRFGVLLFAKLAGLGKLGAVQLGGLAVEGGGGVLRANGMALVDGMTLGGGI